MQSVIQVVENWERVVSQAAAADLPSLIGHLERLKAIAHFRMLKEATLHTEVHEENMFLTIPEVANRLGIPQSRAYELARQHKLQAVRIGKYVRVPLGKLQEYEKSLPQV